MDPKTNTLLNDVSFFRLVAMFLTPFAVKLTLEKVTPSHNKIQAAGIHYRNNLLRFSHMDEYIDRSASVVAGCFVALALLTFALPNATLYLAVSTVMMLSIFHLGVLGLYRHVLTDRVEKYAKIIGIKPPKVRDEPKEFPQHREERLKRDRAANKGGGKRHK
jgi:hypothetical protein